MSGGGKKQTTTETRDPWGPALPYLTDSLGMVGSAAEKKIEMYSAEFYQACAIGGKNDVKRMRSSEKRASLRL
jgi:hypothetical protein